MSVKWSSKYIETGKVKVTVESKKWLLPISQIYSYCVRNNTRYGYIITDAELVAVRIHWSEQQFSQPPSDAARSSPEPVRSANQRASTKGTLKYKAIPWKKCDKDGAGRKSNNLTVNLALWWLHLMATGNTVIEHTNRPLRDEPWGSDANKQGEACKAQVKAGRNWVTNAQDQVSASDEQMPDAPDQVPEIDISSVEQVSTSWRQNDRRPSGSDGANHPSIQQTSPKTNKNSRKRSKRDNTGGPNKRVRF